jgi:predicted alpha/beta superfamily hydrolase
MLLLLLAATSCVHAPAGDPIVVGQRYVIPSRVLNEDRVYQIALPESYVWAHDRRFPVLLVLDSEREFLHTAVAADYLAQTGEMPEMIVVGIISTVRIRDYTQTDWATAWVGGGGAANFRRFLSDELLPELDRTHRTDGFRAIAGHSAGGQFVLYCLTAEPGLFRAYVALSPSLDWDNNLPQRSLDDSLAVRRRLNASLYIARSDDAGRALADYERLVATLQARTPAGFRWHSQPFPDETHVSVPLLSTVDALRWIYQGYRLHDDSLSGGIQLAEQHFRAVSERVGWPLPVPEEVINGLGYEALGSRRIQEAIDLFKRNVTENPNSANAFDSLADGLAEAGRLGEAVQAAEKASALATRHNLPNRDSFARHAKTLKDRHAKESGITK